MPFRQPSRLGIPATSVNHPNKRSAVVTVTGSLVVSLPGVRTLKLGGRLSSLGRDYIVESVGFEDAGGAPVEESQRVSALKNADGTFTIYVEGTTDGLAWIPSVTATQIRYNVALIN